MADHLTILQAIYDYVAATAAGPLAPHISDSTEQELAALNAAIEALRGQSAVAVDVEALAREAVEAMGDVFYDPDPQVDGYSAEELRSHIVSCIANAIRRALAQALPRLEENDGRLVDFYVKAGKDYWLARISIHDRTYTRSGWETDGEFRPVQEVRRYPSNRAVEIAFYGPTGYGPNDFLTSKKVSLGQAVTYLKALGINPEPLLERAREKGWEV